MKKYMVCLLLVICLPLGAAGAAGAAGARELTEAERAACFKVMLALIDRYLTGHEPIGVLVAAIRAESVREDAYEREDARGVQFRLRDYPGIAVDVQVYKAPRKWSGEENGAYVVNDQLSFHLSWFADAHYWVSLSQLEQAFGKSEDSMLLPPVTYFPPYRKASFAYEGVIRAEDGSNMGYNRNRLESEMHILSVSRRAKTAP